MAKRGPAHDGWVVLPHGKLLPLAENLWWCWGALPGMSLQRTMTVARRSDGGLVIYNAIALDEASMEQLESFGEPAFVVVPNAWHRLDAPAFKARYPRMKVLAPKGARAGVSKVVAVDGTLDDFPSDVDVSFEALGGIADAEGAMLVRSKDGLTVVLADVVFNMDTKRDFLGYLFTTVLGSAPGPRVSRLAKLMLVKNNKALRADLERFAALPDLARLIVAHEKVATGADAKSALLQAATYL